MLKLLKAEDSMVQEGVLIYYFYLGTCSCLMVRIKGYFQGKAMRNPWGIPGMRNRLIYHEDS